MARSSCHELILEDLSRVAERVGPETACLKGFRGRIRSIGLLGGEGFHGFGDLCI